MTDDYVERLDVTELPEKRKQELVSFLVDAILDKRVLFRSEHDEKLDHFFKKVCDMKHGVNKLHVKPIVLVLANTVWQALKIEKKKYMYVRQVTDTKVLGAATDKI